jgi:D-alanyl-D-alanine carboxypeptidase/D-alanyl-D-alanine-endopeptidase (penicillin-binding protein 4)
MRSDIAPSRPGRHVAPIVSIMKFPRVLSVLVLLGLCVMSRRALAAAPASAPPVPKDRAALRAWLEGHVTQSRFSGALWGVKIVSLQNGDTWFEHHADRLMSPASNSKLYTGALALDQLGGDYRIHSPVMATVAPDAGGIVRGDVVVGGRGDPSWKTRGGSRNFWDAFDPFVAVLARAGVKRVTGDLVADATWFHALPHGAGWTADDLNDYYGAEISAITLEQNYAEVRVTPGAAAGAPATALLVQPHTGLGLDNRIVTSAAGGARRIVARRLGGENIVHLFGELPQGGKPESVDVTVPRPADWFAAGAKEALARKGIVVEGRARSVRWPEASAGRDGAVKLGDVVSPPMRDLVTAFMKPSQNLETDLIFGHLGELRRTADAPVWRSTEDLAVVALREFLEKSALPADEVRFEEGSGLSRNNLTTANATVALLVHMARHRAAADFLASLPVAGVDGTLRSRMKGTAAEGNVRAKTGSLRYANSLAGYVTTQSGERLAFSLMLNRNSRQPANRNVREELDDIAAVLAAFGGPAPAGR